MARAPGRALGVDELGRARAEGVLRQGEFVARAPEGERELGELQFRLARRRVRVRAQHGELSVRRGVLPFEGLGAFDGQGCFQRVPL